MFDDRRGRSPRSRYGVPVLLVVEVPTRQESGRGPWVGDTGSSPTRLLLFLITYTY